MVSPIKVIEGISPLSIPQELIGANEPVLFKSLVVNWPAVQRGLESDQSLIDYLSGMYSGSGVVLYSADVSKDGRYFYGDDYKSLDFDNARTTLDQVFDLLNNSAARERRNFYVGSTTVDQCLPNFRDENDVGLIDVDPLVSIWLGTKSRVAAHFDAPDNLACCVAGKRTFTLFPIEQVKNLYPGPIDFTPSGQMISCVDFSQPDYDKHPNFKDALEHAVVAELEPGDALYLPSMWWHHVESHSDFNVLVNYWWRDVPKYADAPINLIYHAILSLRDLPNREKQAWKVLFDHFIFDDQSGKYDHLPTDALGALGPLTDQSSRKLRALLLNKLNR